jgi:integrase
MGNTFKPKTAIELRNKDKADFIYDYAERGRERIDGIYANKEISDRNKQLFTDFIRYCQTEGLSLATINKHLDKLKNIGVLIRKDIDKIKRNDVEDLLISITKKYEGSAESIKMHIFTFKKVVGWYYKDENSELINWIKLKQFTKIASKRSDKERYDNIITPQEVELMISRAENPRDKALMGVLFYSGARLSGILDLKIKDITFEEHITWLNVYEGKSGFRKVPITEVTKLLQNWLACHVDKNNPNAYLWAQEKTLKNLNNFNSKNEREEEHRIGHISVRRINDIIEDLARKCNITKRVNPHNWRHSRITHLKLSGLDDDYLKMYAGHSKFSNVGQLYKHLGTNELKSAMEKLYGVKTNEKKVDLLTKCFRCEFMNRSSVSVCENCGMALSSEFSNKLDKEQVKKIKVSKIIGKLLEEPAFKKAIARLLIDQGMVDYVKDLAEEEK